MTQDEFDALKPGDLVHHPAQPDNVWTVVGVQIHYGTLLAIRGWRPVTHALLRQYLIESNEDECRVIAARFKFEVTRMINPGNWDKKKNSST